MPFTIPEPPIQIDPGSYTATLEKVEEFESQQYGTSRRWHWLVDVNGEVKSMSSLTSANTGPRSKSYEYLTALLGRAPATGETLEDPTGSRVVLKLVTNEKGFPKVDAITPYVAPQTVMDGVPR